MTPGELEKWKSAQIAAAVALGINPLDAASAMRSFLAMLPQGADPATYIVPSERLEQDIMSDAIVQDSRSEWYGAERIPSTYKRLLDATASNG